MIFWYPGLTASCPRCMLESRYKKVLSKPERGTGSSAGAAVCVTEYLNAIKAYVVLNILCYNEEKTPYYHKLDMFADRNYFMTKCTGELKAPAFEVLSQIEAEEKDLSFPFATIAIGQEPEKDCPLCGGSGNIENRSFRIEDTRKISE